MIEGEKKGDPFSMVVVGILSFNLCRNSDYFSFWCFLSVCKLSFLSFFKTGERKKPKAIALNSFESFKKGLNQT